MVFVAERTIDELGRIVVPTEARQAKGWGKGTKIAIYIHNGTLVLKESKLLEEKEPQLRIAAKASPH